MLNLDEYSICFTLGRKEKRFDVLRNEQNVLVKNNRLENLMMPKKLNYGSPNLNYG